MMKNARGIPVLGSCYSGVRLLRFSHCLPVVENTIERYFSSNVCPWLTYFGYPTTKFFFNIISVTIDSVVLYHQFQTHECDRRR